MKAKDMTMIAAMAAVISICSWISIPAAIPFTMQTFGIFAALLLLGGKRGTAAIGLYLLLGMAGVPVFSGFQSGIGHIIGPTGGYIVGFLFVGIIYILGEASVGKKGKILLLFFGLLLCYLLGTLWYMAISAAGKSFWAIGAVCVFPYILPDTAKLILAWKISERIQKRKT